MALKIRKKISDVVWSDISSDFNLDSQGNLKIANNVDSVVTSMTNIINTFTGERPMLLEFGSNLKNVLFNNIDKDTLDIIATQIRDTIEKWDDRVKIIEITSSADIDNGFINVNIVFQIKSYQGTFDLTTQLN